MTDDLFTDRSKIYLQAIAWIVLVAFGAIVLIAKYRPEQEIIPLVTIVLGFLAPTILSLRTMIESKEARILTQDTQVQVAKIQERAAETHAVAEETKSIAVETQKVVDGKMAELGEKIVAVEFANGVKEGITAAAEIAAQATAQATAETTRTLIAEEVAKALAPILAELRAKEKNHE